MSALRLARAVLAFLALAALAGAAHAAATVTFTADEKGTFPKTLRYDAKEKLLTVDLSGLPKDAGVFRAELILNDADRFAQVPVEPTTVYAERGGQEPYDVKAPLDKLGAGPDPFGRKPLKLVGPRFRGLDAREAVEAALKAGAPLRLRLQVTLAGASRLEVSCSKAKPRAADIPKASDLKVTHRKGQSLLTFAEPKLEAFPEFKAGADVAKFRDEFLKSHPATTLRIWRCPERISPETVPKATLVGECGFLSAWNSAYHQDETGKQPPVRYRVTDLGKPLPWGTGVYAHNPAEAGKAYYAVTVAVGGEEDLDALGAATAEPVDETVGLGEPVLQWEEHPKDWQYRQGPLTRLIYTRWESWPDASAANTPIDYLVAMGDDPPPAVLPREAENRAYRVEPAPVGLHLHCWGGSLNGGYGWWYNAHRGAVLIASNQVPYDWWTGYHERLRTAKTFGDGLVQPFTMTRMLAFLDWAGRQWQEAPEAVRKHWRKLDPTRVFTAGSSMGGSGAPMYPIRFGDRIAWCIAWVGVHVPAESPGFHESYQGVYGPRDTAITMPDGKTSPWDWFSDVWWLRNNSKAETGFIIASNGKDDGAIGWPQAYAFARTLQETHRPHLYNWGMSGHGTRTVVGANFDIDVRTDQTLPAFTNGTLDGNIGTGKLKTKEEMAAETARLEDEARKAGKDPKQVRACPTDGDPEGAYNAHLAWETGDVTDTPEAWEMTVVLKASAPKDSCKVDLTPRRCQEFRTPQGAKFAWLVIDAQTAKIVAEGTVVADACDLVTLKQIPLVKGKNRVRIIAAR